MNTTEAARVIGIKPKALRTFLRKSKSGVGSGSRYDFSHDEVMAMKDAYWEALAKPNAKDDGDGLGEGSKGLPLQWLNDPSKKAAFAAEQRARLERLNARLREVKLDVPHMTDKELKVNGRAMRVEEINA
ncbi:HTH DNA binding protein [Mycobacterium phage FF47]|uniref:Uncharacterized protein n=2 Tax=Mapvirus Ff47 TaxID=1920751 RepID=A0A899INA9_9CAUD|nr:HTH DNA binding protein [Mycobacterium phage FF47]QSL99643.1 hypothetical protein [Mycobacterium phage Maco2]QXN76716.1 hypothetical protein [Mycobacterium phage Maco7]UNY41958.1 hypothetical protein [Mycobacterium phage Maco6]WKV22153.1 HTH DNA binding protein [Mycobacteroides phage 8UZL]AGI12302.1 hypothetical protein FF47_34 [Mycobacterium phage FF47]